jgi:tetratricopeptide (TPR) repeat protein
MARIARELADISLEKSSLEKYVAKTNDSFASELRLAEIAFEEKNWGETIKHANAAIAVTPLRPAPYRLLAHAGNQTKDPAIVADACRALLEMDPLDPAQSHFDYASALVQTNDLPKARLQILKSLEYAPRFRDAHKLLLQINKKIEQDTPASTEQPLPANKSDKTPTKTSSPTTIRNR